MVLVRRLKPQDIPLLFELVCSMYPFSDAESELCNLFGLLAFELVHFQHPFFVASDELHSFFCSIGGRLESSLERGAQGIDRLGVALALLPVGAHEVLEVCLGRRLRGTFPCTLTLTWRGADGNTGLQV